jgi:hypothetical protein
MAAMEPSPLVVAVPGLSVAISMQHVFQIRDVLDLRETPVTSLTEYYG